MSIHRNRQVATCEKCHNARASEYGRWCPACWAKLSNEERLAAAELAAQEDDSDPRLAPPRLATHEERRNGHSYPELHYIVVTPQTTAESQALKRDGWTFSHFTALGTRVWKRAR
jgi:hypothetical protein